MRQIWEDMKYFFTRDWTMPEKILIIICCILLGMIKGFFLAPVKNGINCGCNNGNNYNGLDDEYWLDDED